MTDKPIDPTVGEVPWWDGLPAPDSTQITTCRPDLGLHIKCEHAVRCSRCDGQGEVAGNAAHTKPPVGCPSCGGTGFKRQRAALGESDHG